MGWKCPPWYGKSDDFYIKEKKKALEKIEKLKEIIKACDEAIAENNKADK